MHIGTGNILIKQAFCSLNSHIKDNYGSQIALSREHLSQILIWCTMFFSLYLNTEGSNMCLFATRGSNVVMSHSFLATKAHKALYETFRLSYTSNLKIMYKRRNNFERPRIQVKFPYSLFRSN